MADLAASTLPPATSTGALAQVVTKEKVKKKKKKLTPKERAKEKIEKAVEKILADPILCNDLFYSVSYWLKIKQKILYKLFHQQCLQSLDHFLFKNEMEKIAEKEKALKEKDKDKDKRRKLSSDKAVEEIQYEINTLSTIDFKLSYDDFILVCTDLDIPCTLMQIYVLIKLLDPESAEVIDYRKFTPEFVYSHLKHQHIDGIKYIKGTESTKFIKSFTFKKELTKHFATQYPLYIKLDLKLVTFANDKEFKGHIKDEIVYSHLKVFSLIEMIKEKTDIASNKIVLYQDYKANTGEKSGRMDIDKTLEEHGYTGKNYNELADSEKVTIYFDYKVLGDNDPIIKSDFYFHDYKNIKRNVNTPGI